MHIKARNAHTNSREIREIEGRCVIFNYTGHLVIGSIVAYFIAHSPVLFMAVLIGSLLPDIDQRNSTLGRYNPFTPFMKHRGHCHSIVGLLIISIPFLLLTTDTIKGTDMYYMVVIGGLSHLFGDKLSSAMKRQKFLIKIW